MGRNLNLVAWMGTTTMKYGENAVLSSEHTKQTPEVPESQSDDGKSPQELAHEGRAGERHQDQ